MDLQLAYRKDTADFRQGLTLATRRFERKAQRRPPVWMSTMLVSGGLAAVVVTLLQAIARGADPLAGIALSFLAVALIAAIARSRILFGLVVAETARGAQADDADQCLRLEPGGLREINGQGERFLPWRSLQSVETAAEGVFVYCTDVNYIHVPRSAFASQEQAEQWAAAVRAAVDAQRAEAPAPAAAPIVPPAAASAAAASAAPARRGFAAALGANLLAGLRIAALLPVAAPALRASPLQLAALVVTALAVSFAADLATVGRDGYFAWYNLPQSLFYVPLVLLLGAVVARLEREPGLLLAIAAGVASAFIWIGVGAQVIFALVASDAAKAAGFENAWWVYYAVFAWGVLAVLRFVAGVAAAGWLPRLRAAALALVVVLFPLMLMPAGDLWQQDYAGDSAAPRHNPAREEALYRQAALLDGALQALKPQRPGVPDLYFLGLGLYGGQTVFRNEIESVTALFDARFGTAGRSLGLINSAETIGQRPLATATSLRRSLAHIAALMDRDEDVLFLYLTSHGSASHRLSVELWPFEFQAIDPALLKQALDEARIRWKVIVVSACYSGGFVEPLKDDTTLIITASDAKRKSFGCGNEFKYTYFGEAYFDQALRQTRSFVAAFEEARRRIAEREARESKTASLPQMFVGAAMADKLAAVETALAAAPAADAAAAADALDAPDAPARLDALRPFWAVSARAAEWREACFREMPAASPADVVRRHPDYYGGITPASRQWPDVVAAWDLYAATFCEAIREPELLQAHARAWSARMSDESIDAAARFFASPHGREFLAARDGADRELAEWAIAVRTAVGRSALDRHVQDMRGIWESVQGEAAATQAASNARRGADAAAGKP